MIYAILKTHNFKYGSMETHYELWQYDHKSEHTGALIGGKHIASAKTKKEINLYAKNNGIEAQDYKKLIG